MSQSPNEELVVSADQNFVQVHEAMGRARQALDDVANNLCLVNQSRITLANDRELVRQALRTLQSTVEIFLTSTTAEPVLTADRMALVRDGLQRVIDHLTPGSGRYLLLPEVPGT